MFGKSTILFLFVAIAFLLPTSLVAQQKDRVAQRNSKNQVVSKLGVRFGKVITVEGLAVKGEPLGTATGPTILVKSIDGKQTQKHIKILVVPVSHNDFGEEGVDFEGVEDLPPFRDFPALPKFSIGSSYKFIGYESGEFLGTPGPILLQTSFLASPRFHFRNKFVVVEGKIIEPIAWKPSDFVGKTALLSGRAKNIGDDAFIVTKDWKLLVSENEPWPKSTAGKLVENLGRIEPTGAATTFKSLNGKRRLVRLDDQVDSRVALRGILRRTNDRWWLVYRNEKVALRNYVGQTKMFGKPVSVSGMLIKAPDERAKFHIDRPEVNPIQTLLSPEYETAK